ncbi:type II toxin-antitoxin system PemK/MazF family toxin [Hippea alviniae]|uniref:type II toxin-antitoxin system PemK/MazF family toxin n=1 Tax=Hippea alviniae TaxID=1279027 RepID=UPI0003B36C81|nr:type II toxin-antitoxin system PemK/MazF family toxin [Hippea alviniae]
MEIYLIELPKTNGHEQHGVRPALVISKPIKQIAIVMPFTSNMTALRFPYTLKVEPSKENGLSFPSVLLIFQIRAIDSKRLVKKLGVLEDVYRNQVIESLKKILNLSGSHSD